MRYIRRPLQKCLTVLQAPTARLGHIISAKGSGFSSQARLYPTIRSILSVKTNHAHTTENRRHLSSDTTTKLFPCPYTTGTRLALAFQAEDGASKTSVAVDVVQPYSPFTLSQAMVVQRIHPHSVLPPRFVIKVVDPRFVEPDIYGLNRKPGWTAHCEDAFTRGLHKIRSGEWTNYWECLGAVRTSEPWYSELKHRANNERTDWMNEMDRWHRLRGALESESTAYGALRALQGSDIPTLYGSCAVLLHKTTPNVDPFVGEVPGLALQHIEGTSLNRLTLGRDLSVSDAERVSQGALAVLRKIRDALVCHGDFADRNVIVRPHDLDHPALIDFGSADTNVAGKYTEKEWIEGIVNDREVLRARSLLGGLGLHNPSPIMQQYHNLASMQSGCGGYAWMNSDIEKMRPDWRDQYFEPVHDVPPDKITITEGGVEIRWAHPRWRVKPGVNTANAHADYMWGKT